MLFSLKNLLSGGSNEPPSEVSEPKVKKVRDKTNETARNLAKIMNETVIQNFNAMSTSTEVLTNVYKMMVILYNDEKLHRELQDNSYEARELALEKRHKTVLKAIKSLSFQPRKKRTVSVKEKGETQDLPYVSKKQRPSEAMKPPEKVLKPPEAPKPTPKATPKETPKPTPKSAPKETPKPTPKATKPTPKSAPKETPKPTPKATKPTPQPSKPAVEPPPKVGGPPAVPSIGKGVALGVAGTLPILANAAPQDKNQSMVYNAFLNAGFSKNQAIALTAEVGRENAYSNFALFGQHPDPGNKETNLGFFSWQKERRAKLIDFMKSKGLVEKDEQGRVNFKMTQESLNAQAEFAMREIKTQKEYTLTKEKFLGNPEINSEEAAQILGANYIRWRYNDPKFESGHRNRRLFEAQIKRKVEQNAGVDPQSNVTGQNVDVISKQNKDLNEQLTMTASTSTTINQVNYNTTQTQQRQPPSVAMDDRSAYERKSRT